MSIERLAFLESVVLWKRRNRSNGKWICTGSLIRLLCFCIRYKPQKDVHDHTCDAIKQWIPHAGDKKLKSTWNVRSLATLVADVIKHFSKKLIIRSIVYKIEWIIVSFEDCTKGRCTIRIEDANLVAKFVNKISRVNCFS